MDMTQLWPIVLVPIINGMIGWLQNATQDGIISKYEWMKGAETLITLGMPAIALWIVGNGVGIDIPAIVAAMIPVMIYWTRKLFKNPTE